MSLHTNSIPSPLNPINATLGIFPALDDIGGVQASGKIAWEGVIGQPLLHKPLLFCYGDGEGKQEGVSFSPDIQTSSKLSAILSALKFRQPVNYILIWHVGLLKLLPFFRVKNAKVVLFLHGIEVWRTQNRLTNRLLRRVDLFLSNSDFTWKRFLQDNPSFIESPHRTVQLGIESVMEGDVPAPSSPPAVLMTSRLLKSEDYKGHREMIGAWPEVLKRTPEAELWVCGDGDLKEDLENEAAENGVRASVRFLGRVSEDEKHDLLARSRCFALPSRGEGFGLVYLEAMRMGRPCLVSMVDAGQEVVNPPEAGLSVNLSCPGDIAAAVCRLLESGTEWQQMSIRARQRHEDFFTAAHFQRRLNSALSSL